MAEPELQLEVRSLHDSAVTDPDDLQLAAEALGDPLDHVGQQGTGKPVKRTILTLVVGPRDREHGDVGIALLHGEDHVLREDPLETTSRAGDADARAVDGDLDTRRDGDGLLADAAHVTKPRTELRRRACGDGLRDRAGAPATWKRRRRRARPGPGAVRRRAGRRGARDGRSA